MLEPLLVRRSIVLLALAAAPASSAAKGPPARVGRFAQQVVTRYSVEEGLPSSDVRRVVLSDDAHVRAETSAGWVRLEGERWHPTTMPVFPTREPVAVSQVRAKATSPSGAEAIVSAVGLFSRATPDTRWQRRAPVGRETELGTDRRARRRLRPPGRPVVRLAAGRGTLPGPLRILAPLLDRGRPSV